MVVRRTLEVADLEGSVRIGRRIGELLFPEAVVALIGQLGAGKTHLVRAIAEGLQTPDSRIVTSPTFVLIQEYPGRLPIYHFDAYRLSNPELFADLGVQEYLDSGGVCLIEWAERIADVLPPDLIRIDIVPEGAESRRFTITGLAGLPDGD